MLVLCNIFIYLTIQSTFLFMIISALEGKKCLNEALNTFDLRLYGIGHMVKTIQSVIEETQHTPLLELLFSVSSKGSFTCTIPQKDTTAFLTPVVEH